MSQLPPNLSPNLYRAEQVRELDRLAIEEQHIPGIDLMERAGLAAFQVMQKRWPDARRILVICGSGNNGGDGYVIARLARQAGMTVSLYQASDASRLRGDALTAAERLQDTDVQLVSGECPAPSDFELVVDALLGTGLQGEVSDHYRQIIDSVNLSGVPVLAVDIPSGLHADSGAVLGAAIRAEQTITFIGMKQGLLTAEGPEYCGEIHFDDLQVPAAVYESIVPAAICLRFADQKHLLGKRSRSTHKGECGHVLVIGGESGFTGAAIMAGEAALRVGAGLVSLATRERHAALISTERPELMCHGVESAEQLQDLLTKVDVLAIGPGLGQSPWAQQLFDTVLATDLPLIIDADALNLLAQQEHKLKQQRWVLTPHPGEAGRLLGQTSQQIQQDRFAAAVTLQSQYGGIVVLKGVGTLVQSSTGPVGVCLHGNPGMATGGMGDVLTGVIAGLVAQGLSLDEAARFGVCLHSLAADDVAQTHGERGLLASDLMAPLRRRVNSEDG